jgi:hypothetical protein
MSVPKFHVAGYAAAKLQHKEIRRPGRPSGKYLK